MSELDPIESSTALELYLVDRGGDLPDATIRSHRSRLSTLVAWLADQGINNLNDLTGRLVKEYQLRRREESGWATVTEKTQMDTVRVFVRWAKGMKPRRRIHEQRRHGVLFRRRHEIPRSHNAKAD